VTKQGRPSKNIVPASSGKEKRGPKIFFATMGVPFANVSNTNNCRISKYCIPAAYLNQRRYAIFINAGNLAAER
jgi:hypothetical protein